MTRYDRLEDVLSKAVVNSRPRARQQSDRSQSIGSTVRVKAPSSVTSDGGDPSDDNDERTARKDQGDTVRARLKDDHVLVVSGLDRSFHSADRQSSRIATGARKSIDDDESDSYNSDDEPNERGLYTKAYVQRHPEVKWTHRGQGFYRAEGEANGSHREATPRKRAADPDSSDDDLVVRSPKRQRSTADQRQPMPEQDDDSPGAARKAEVVSSYGLRQRHVNVEPTAAERRAERMSRRSGPTAAYFEDSDEDSDEQSSMSDEQTEDEGAEETERTYTKSYVASHPEIKFRHVGNGFYRRVSSEDGTNGNHNIGMSQASRSSRRSSGQSSATIDPEHRSSLNNGQLRLSTTDGIATSNGSEAVSPNPSQEDLGHTSSQSFSKSEMLAYKKQHPDAVFLHRGNGRYKRASHSATQDKQPVDRPPQERVTYSKSYVEAHTQFDFYHCGAGRYKRIHHLPALEEETDSFASAGNTMKHGSSSDEHPGASQGSSASEQLVTEQALGDGSSQARESLYDRTYVDEHPDETFHHRGQGRWAKGLPPPGSSSKMAVRGPGSKLVKSVSHSSSESQKDRMPKPGELFRKDEGPLKWPELDWTYRGGGKWVLNTKSARGGRSKQNNAASEAIIDHDPSELDSNASTSRRGSVNGVELGRPRVKRARSALQSIEADEDEDDALIVRSPVAASVERMLSLEEDTLTDSDLPELYLDSWPPIEPGDTDDEAEEITRTKCRPLNDAELFIRSMTKHDPAVRPTETLYRLAEHMQHALSLMQDEYLELDKITAPHARIPRRVATGGRLPIDPMVHEDRKEADLYNYTFDPKKIGFQDPVAQRIVVDVDGRGLRKRRKRNEVDTDPGAIEEAPLGRRVTKPVQRFDGNPAPQSRRPRSILGRGSATPDPVITPEKRAGQDADSYNAPSSGRWANHIPKRIRELRGGSAGPGKPSDEAESHESDSAMDDSPQRRGQRVLGEMAYYGTTRGL